MVFKIDKVNNLNIIDYIKMFISIFKYFTFWVIPITILYILGYIDYFWVIFILNIIILFTFTILVIQKKKLHIKLYKANIQISGKELQLFELIFHYLPFFILIILKKNNFGGKSLLLLPIIYFIIVDIKKIYKLEPHLAFISYFSIIIIFLFMENMI